MIAMTRKDVLNATVARITVLPGSFLRALRSMKRFISTVSVVDIAQWDALPEP